MFTGRLLHTEWQQVTHDMVACQQVANQQITISALKSNYALEKKMEVFQLDAKVPEEF
jgi:hypothetical protein